MLKQMLQIIRLLGLRRAARMKKRYEKALPFARGYCVTTALWSLLKLGFWDEVQSAGDGGMNVAEYADRNDCDLHVLGTVCSYLDGVGIVAYDHGRQHVKLTGLGRDLLAEPRGLFELTYAYEPAFVNLEAMLRGEKRYGEQVQRRTDWVGIGSGRLCRQLPYPVMMDMVRRHGCRNVLDLGCGDGALLLELAAADRNIRGVGIDLDEGTAELAAGQIGQAGHGDRLRAMHRDMFQLPLKHDDLGEIDCLTACDTFHEYLWESDAPVVELLRDLRATFPNAKFVIGEFCRQSHEWLRRHPTAFLEHHLFHQLSNQHIESAEAWRDIFKRAGLTIKEEKVFDLVGHGYFVLE